MARILRSNGETTLCAYVVTDVPRQRREPAPGVRVELVDPRATPTVELRPVRRAPGPRNPELNVWPPPPTPLLDLPDGLPANKAQRVILAPELVAQWREEARIKGNL